LKTSAARPALPRCAAALAAAALLAIAAPVPAAPPIDDATRASARQLGDEAKELFDKGDYAGALDKYNRADALVHVPTIGVRAARCLERMGKLIESAERYLEVTRMELPADALPVHREALVQAENERNAVLPRIPSVVVELAGDARGVTVTIDGTELPAALLGARRAVNPGHHEITATLAGAVLATGSADVKEGETRAVRLILKERPPEPPPCAGAGCPGSPGTLAPPSSSVPGGSLPLAPTSKPVERPPHTASPALRIAGFVAIGVGVRRAPRRRDRGRRGHPEARRSLVRRQVRRAARVSPGIRRGRQGLQRPPDGLRDLPVGRARARGRRRRRGAVDPGAAQTGSLRRRDIPLAER
jgi:hypothetical protein